MGTLLLIVSLLLQARPAQSTPHGTISGTLLSAGGEPAAHVRIGATLAPEPGASRSSDDFESLTETDADGRFVLQNLPSGKYLVASGLVSAPYYYPGVTTRSSATAIVVKANSTVTGIDFILKGVNVRGRIVPHPTQIDFEIPEVSLRIDGVTLQKTGLGRDNSFTFLNVVPGRYTVMSTGGAETDLTVPETELTNLEIAMPAVAQFKVRMSMESGGRPPEVPVLFKGAHNYTSPGPGPTFGMLLPVGEYSVSLPADLKGYALKAIEVDGVSSPPATLKITEEHARRFHSTDQAVVVLILGTVAQ